MAAGGSYIRGMRVTLAASLGLQLSLCLSACTDPIVGGDPDAGADSVDLTDSGDDGEIVVGDAALDLTATIAEKVHTVVVVEWRTEEETTGYVQFGPGVEYTDETVVTATGTVHRTFLLGTPPDTEVHFRVVVRTAEGLVASTDHTITTQSLPSGFPTFTVNGDLGGRWRYMVMPTQGTAAVVPIVDALGRVVWYYVPVGGGNLMKAVLAHDRQHVILGFAGNQGELETSRVLWISLDGADVQELAVPYFDHDLTELPNGDLACIVVDERDKNGQPWSADKIVEVTPAGEMTTIWNAWDAFDPVELGLDQQGNWTHANGIEYVPSEDAYYLAMKGPGTVAKIPRSTATVEWLLNGRLNQFAFLDGAVPGVLQHQFEVLGDGHLLLFDNGSMDRGYSRAVELQLDVAARTAKELWSYSSVPPIFVFAKGDVQRYADGATQVTWSTAGEIQMVDAAGTLLWQLNSPLGQAFTFVQPVMSFYEDR